MKRKHYQIIMGRREKCIRQKNCRDPIVRATATNLHGEIYECLQEDIIVATMVKSNLRW